MKVIIKQVLDGNPDKAAVELLSSPRDQEVSLTVGYGKELADDANSGLRIVYLNPMQALRLGKLLITFAYKAMKARQDRGS